MSKVKSYKGFKIQEGKDTLTNNAIFKVYTKDEWSYGKGFRSYEWEACTMQEAIDFIDSYNDVEESARIDERETSFLNKHRKYLQL